ncbi:MAG: YqeG family HAD IIIA-type phosphatase [Cyanobacteriota bacterium]
MFFKLKADYILQHVTDIDLKDLKSKGIKGFVFDLDNTIMAPKTGRLTEDIEDWLKKVKEDFKIAVVSNNHKDNYIENAAKVIGCPVYGKAKKPQVKIIMQTLEEMELKPNEIAVVGDRPLTDIWVGKKLGSVTILVDPLMKDNESELVKILRKLERSFIEEPAET